MTEYLVTHDGDLSAALGKAEPGDRITLRGGIYRAAVNITRGGEAGRPLHILPYGTERPIFDFMLQPSQFVVAAPYVSIYGLRFQNGSCVRTMPEGHHVEFYDCESCLMTGNAFNLMGSDGLLQNCRTWAVGLTQTTRYHGIYLSGDRITLRGCKVGTVPGYAVHVYNNAAGPQGCIVEDCLMAASYRSGLLIQGAGHRIRRNKIYGCTTYAFGVAFTPSVSETVIEGNDIYSLTAAVYGGVATPELPIRPTLRGNTIRGMVVDEGAKWMNDIKADNVYLPGGTGLYSPWE